MAQLTIEQYLERLDRVIRDLERQRPQEAQKIANDTLALVKRRVINTGQAADGTQFSPYSPQYAELRESRGRPTSYKNFSFVGTMWKETIPVVRETRPGVSIIEISASGNLSKDKIRWNSTREGKAITDLSQDEQELLNELNQERLTNLFKKYGID